MNKTCRLCGQALPPKPLFELAGMPSGAQYYPTPAEFTGDTGVHLRLFVCAACELYQLDSAAVSYYRDVIRPSGFSRTMIEFRRKQFAEMVQRFNLTGKKVFECGCGQGEFLALWNEFPVEAYGVEHHADLVQSARSKGLRVQQGFVGSGEDTLAQGPFDAFTSFNFLEHQPDPNGMLQGIYRNLAEGGAGLITVPSLEYILDNDAYYELIVDHLLYFSRKTFTSILQKNGFRVVQFDDTIEDTHCAFVVKETPPDRERLNRCRIRIDSALASFVKQQGEGGGRIAVWGASHQGFTLLSGAGIASSVDFIIDSAPFKHGKFAPVSHLEILPPDVLAAEKLAAIIVIAPNYAEEIFQIIRQKYHQHCPVAIVRRGRLETRSS
ncbi:MAG: class I SAM-dependent methyltransferase [Chthoniobacteraceae bacterium]|nr:class I SAM-dependent methyltransferase [Chthoniobacteraceae bacterium]